MVGHEDFCSPESTNIGPPFSSAIASPSSPIVAVVVVSERGLFCVGAK